MARPLQFQQQRTAGHVLELAPRVAPVPAAAQLLAQWRSAPRRVRGQQSADQFDIRVVTSRPCRTMHLCHGAKSTATGPTESSPKTNFFRLRSGGGGRLCFVLRGLAGANSQVPARCGRAPEQLRITTLHPSRTNSLLRLFRWSSGCSHRGQSSPRRRQLPRNSTPRSRHLPGRLPETVKLLAARISRHHCRHPRRVR